jgi:hypothetical protein
VTPAEELRAAADKIRSLAKAIDAPGLPDQSWHTEECASEERGDCPCIVAQGRSIYHHGEPPTPLFYVADAETPECAAYIAAMHPGVGTALADWLDQAAHHYECGIRAADDVFRDDPTGRDAFLTTGPGAPSPHALAVARQILGATP